MSWPIDRPRLEVHESFETTRFGPQFLIEAYNRVIPVRRKAIRKTESADPRPAAGMTRRRGGEHV